MSGHGVGARLNMIRLRLERVAADLRRMRLAALAEGATPGGGARSLDPMARARWMERQMAPQLQALHLLHRDLMSIEHGLDNRQRIAHLTPRVHRWAERQSIASSRDQSRLVFQLLSEVIEALRALQEDGARPSVREVSDAAADAAKDYVEFVQGLGSHMAEIRALIAAPVGPMVGPAVTTVQNVSWEGMVLAAWLLARWLTRPRRPAPVR